MYSSPLNKSHLRYIFQSDDSVKVVFDGGNGNVSFTFNGNRLTINGLQLVINYLDQNRLILDEEKDTLALQIWLVSVKIHYLGFMPQTFITQGNDTIYMVECNDIKPLFNNQA